MGGSLKKTGGFGRCANGARMLNLRIQGGLHEGVEDH